MTHKTKSGYSVSLEKNLSSCGGFTLHIHDTQFDSRGRFTPVDIYIDLTDQEAKLLSGDFMRQTGKILISL